MIKKRIIPASLLVLLSAISTVPANAVEYVLPDTNGQQQSLAQYQGKWLIVNFWATWCGVCMQELPELANFHTNNKFGATVVGINFEAIEAKELHAFVSRKDIPYPVLATPPVRSTPLGAVPALPTTYIIDPEGNVVAGEIGIVTSENLETYIRSKSNSTQL